MEKPKIVEALTKEAMVEEALLSSKRSHFVISITCLPVFVPDVIDAKRDDIRSTNGLYFIEYCTKGMRGYCEGHPYTVGCDLLKINLKVSGPKHFRACSQEFPEVRWLTQYTNYNDALFAIARMHQGMPIYFSVDWAKYTTVLRNKVLEEKGTLYGYRPLVVYKAKSSGRTIDLDTIDLGRDAQLLYDKKGRIEGLSYGDELCQK